METIPFGFLSAGWGGLSVVGLLVFDRGNIIEVAVEPLAVDQCTQLKVANSTSSISLYGLWSGP
jgi:hypothetical protein